jgi:hypothetical protein
VRLFLEGSLRLDCQLGRHVRGWRDSLSLGCQSGRRSSQCRDLKVLGGWIDVWNIAEVTKLNMISWISLGLRPLFTVLA